MLLLLLQTSRLQNYDAIHGRPRAVPSPTSTCSTWCYAQSCCVSRRQGTSWWCSNWILLLYWNHRVTSSSGVRSTIFTTHCSVTMIQKIPIAFHCMQPLSLDTTSSQRGRSSKSTLQISVCTIKTGWAVQLNGDATFGFCRTDIDVIALCCCSFGGSNNLICFSYIQHRA